jgi:hypothetical protein
MKEVTKAQIGFWFGDMNCGEVIVEIDTINNSINNSHIDKAREKAYYYANMLDREVLPYLKEATAKVYHIWTHKTKN